MKLWIPLTAVPEGVVAVARKGQAPLAQIAKDFGISEGSLSNWLKQPKTVQSARHRLSSRIPNGLAAR